MTSVSARGDATALRVAGWAAIAFSVLFAAGVFLLNTPEGNDSVREWTRYFDDGGNRTLAIIHGYAWALAGIAFLIFVCAIRERLHVVAGWVGTLAFASGIVFVGTLFVAAAATAAVAGGVEFGDTSTRTAGEFGRWFEQLGFATLLLCGMMAAGVFLVTASGALGRGGVLPRWMVVVGYVVGGLVFVFGVLFIPLLLLFLWALIAGIILVNRSATTTESGAEATAHDQLG